MEKITKALLEETAREVLNEYNSSHVSGEPNNNTPPASDQVPGPRRSSEKEASEVGLEPEEGFHKSGFGISSNAFAGALKSIVKKELDKMLKQKEKKA